MAPLKSASGQKEATGRHNGRIHKGRKGGKLCHEIHCLLSRVGHIPKSSASKGCEERCDKGRKPIVGRQSGKLASRMASKSDHREANISGARRSQKEEGHQWKGRNKVVGVQVAHETW